MSKVIKQMQLDALKKTFDGVRDMVLLNVVGLSAGVDNALRLDLRKKGIRLQMVKNTLARKVFRDYGLVVNQGWETPTTIAWGSSSVAELAKEVEAIVKKHDKFMKVKIAVAEGQEVPFAVAIKMPTRVEAIGRVVSLAMSPARRVAGQLGGPAARVASQIKTVSEREPAAAEPAPAEAAPASA